MQNQEALHSIYSAKYLKDYLDGMDNLPGDIQMQITRMRNMVIEYSGYMEDVETTLESLIGDLQQGKEGETETKQPAVVTKKKLQAAQMALMKAQNIEDEKLQFVQNIQDVVEDKSRQLKLDKTNLDELTNLHPRENGREMENAKEHAPPNRSIKRRAKHEVFVPSILGPSTLEVTSFVDSNSQGSHPLPIPTKSNQNYSRNLSLTNVNTYIKTEPNAGPSSHRNTKAPSRENESAAAGSARGVRVGHDVDHSLQGRNSEITNNAASISSSATAKRQTQKLPTGEKKPKRHKVEQTENNEASLSDPDEPTYCICEQVSYGDMIGCDNDLCPNEWFHFSCVNLVNKPKGKWYCPKCRGDKPNIMKSMPLFLKELEKYNREKEEEA